MLFEEHDGGGSINLRAADLGPDLVAEAFRLVAPEVAAGARLGPFVIEREIGRGGMGSVYLARREDPSIEQHVAIKFLHPGLFDDKAVARFQSEEQILARLKHPGIALFFDASVTEAGTPYFVMEYVEGWPITTYSEERGLTVEERLRIFLDVVDAVAFAQQNLVVHRDIKPGNILVTAQGCAKLLDFGIAKMLDPDNTDATQTQTRLVTPSYATPEQLTSGRITTATDVFALGVVLYELLSGRHPFGAADLSQSKLIRAICETVPQRVSAAVATSAQEGSRDELATGARRLQKRLRGDLGAILERSLRKNPADRYASAAALGDDIRRHLNGIPVEARRGSRWYAAKRWGKKNRRELLAAVTVLVGVFAGLGAFAFTLSQKEDQLLRERSQLIEWGRVYREVFTGRGTLTENLDSSFERVASSYGHDPETGALLLQVIGNMYGNLREYDRGIRALELAIQSTDDLGKPSMARAYALGSLAILLADSSGSGHHEKWQLDSLTFAALDEGSAAGQPSTDFLRIALQMDIVGRLMRSPSRERQLVDTLLVSLSILAEENEIDGGLRRAIGALSSVREGERRTRTAQN